MAEIQEPLTRKQRLRAELSVSFKELSGSAAMARTIWESQYENDPPVGAEELAAAWLTDVIGRAEDMLQVLERVEQLEKVEQLETKERQLSITEGPIAGREDV